MTEIQLHSHAYRPSCPCDDCQAVRRSIHEDGPMVTAELQPGQRFRRSDNEVETCLSKSIHPINRAFFLITWLQEFIPNRHVTEEEAQKPIITSIYFASSPSQRPILGRYIGDADKVHLNEILNKTWQVEK